MIIQEELQGTGLQQVACMLQLCHLSYRPHLESAPFLQAKYADVQLLCSLGFYQVVGRKKHLGCRPHLVNPAFLQIKYASS